MKYLEILNSNDLQITNIYYVILKNQIKFLFNDLNKINCHGSLDKLRNDIIKSIEDINSIDEDKYFEIQNLIKKNIHLLPELAIDDLEELNNYINEMKDKSMVYIVEQYYNNRLLTLYYNGYFRMSGYFHIKELKSIFFKEQTYEFWNAQNIQKNEYQNQIELLMAEKKFKVNFMPSLLDYLQENRKFYRSRLYGIYYGDFVEIFDKGRKKSFDVNAHPFKIMVFPCYELAEVFIFITINPRYYSKKGFEDIRNFKLQMASVFSSSFFPSIIDLQLNGTVTDKEKEYLLLFDKFFGVINYITIPMPDINPEKITLIVDKYVNDLAKLQSNNIDYLSIYKEVESGNVKVPSIIEKMAVVKSTTEIVKSHYQLDVINEDELLQDALIRMYIYEMYILSVVSEYNGKNNRVSYSFLVEQMVNNTSPVITPYKYIGHFREINPEEILMYFDVKIVEFPDIKPMLISTDMVRDYFSIIKEHKSLKCLDELEDYIIDNAIALLNKNIINIKKRKKLILMDHELDQEYGIDLLKKLFDRIDK